MRTSLHDLLRDAAAAWPDAPALTYRDETITYADAWAGATGAALLLRGLGLERGDRVAIFLEKRIEAVLAMFAATAAGGMFVPINHVLKSAQVAHILTDSGARVLVTSGDRLGHLAADLAGTAVEHVIVVGAMPSTAPTRAVHSWSTAQAASTAGEGVVDAIDQDRKSVV